MQGMVASAIADIDVAHATNAYAASNVPPDAISHVQNTNALNDTIRGGKRAITVDGMHIIQSDLIDVVVEATGIPEVGAEVAYHTLMHKKHLVMVNVETDVTVGPFLRRLADNAGVVYTLVDGDQPGVTMNIVEWAKTLGFEIVAAGRGTVFYDDDRVGIPDTVPQRFGFSEELIERRAINFKMFNSFRDGSKAQIEMTSLANMAGLPPDIRGMHEPSVNISDIARSLQFKRRRRHFEPTRCR